MASLPLWLTHEWFTLLQSVGILGGLLFTALAFWRDIRARRTTDLLQLAEQHRSLWSELHKRPELGRILDEHADLIAQPVTPTEFQFLNLVLVHYYVGYLLALVPRKATRADIRNFFRLPLPKAVWNETRNARDPEFVAFVDECLAS